MSMFAEIRTAKSPGLVADENFAEAEARIAGYIATFSNTSAVDVVHLLGYHPTAIEVYVGGVKTACKVERLNDDSFRVTFSGTKSGEIRYK